MTEDARQHEAGATADGRLPLPRLTTPTWEVELLLSAGLVFALFQVPGPLHQWSALAGARLGDSGDLLASMLMVYALMAVYALIATFLVHLTARAYWVALVGIASVYPGGVRWDKFAGGPISRAEMQRQIPSIAGLVERADNMASLVFAFGLVVVMSSLLGAMLALPTVGLAILLAATILPDTPLQLLMGGLLVVVLLPFMGIGVADKLLGRRPPGSPPPPPWFERLVTRFQRLPLNRLPAPLMLMIATNQRGKRAYILFVLAMVLMMGFLITDLIVRRGEVGYMAYEFLPERQAGGAYPRYYRDERQDPLSSWSTPSIDGMVVEGDWLRLLVPYDPERHETLLARECAGPQGADLAAALDKPAGDRDRGHAEARVLDCIGSRLALTIDGEPAGEVSFAFSEDPGTGLPALLAMIPAADLAPGRHELAVQRFPDDRTLRDEERMEKFRQAGPLRIPFWR